MAKFEFKLPDIGEGVTEGEIVAWLIKVGDDVTENQDMVEVMTDKATVTIPSPKSGRVADLRGEVGTTVPVGHVLVVLDLGGNDAAQVGATDPVAVAPALASMATGRAEGVEQSTGVGGLTSNDEGPVASAVGDIRLVLPGTQLSEGGAARSSEAWQKRPLAAPATRRLARELGVDLARVNPSGKGGRVTPRDVEQAHQGQSAPPALLERAASVPVEESSGVHTGSSSRVKIRGIRRRIYDNMARSKRTAAHFTFVDECEVSSLRAIKDRLSPLAESASVKLTFLPFIVKAVVRALKANPALNATVDDEAQEVLLSSRFDIGIATSTDQGLIVPVLRDADRKSILDIAREIARLGLSAKSGRIAPADLGGSTFTITSLGKLGGLFATPVINYPEVAILGVHEMRKRPIVRDDQIVIGEVMLLSLSFDHRIIDGHVGAAFARSLIEALEDPDKLVLDL